MNSMRHTTLKQLRYLSAVIRLGSVSAAAADLCVTPPAVTAQIKTLEDLVGLPLVERQGDRFRATPAGEEIAGSLRKIEALLVDCAHALVQLKTGATGRVSFGIVSSAKYFAPMAIAGFRRLRATVDIRLMVGNREEVLAGLRSFELDLAIMGTPPPDLPLEAETIGDHPLIMIAPPDHRLAGRPRLRPEDLAAETFLVREPDSGTRGAFEKFMGPVFDERPRREMEMNSNESIKQAVIAGLGLAFLSGHTVASEIKHGRLALLDVVGLPIVRRWYVVRRADRRLLPAAQAMLTFWIERGASYLPQLVAPADPLEGAA